MVGEVINNKRDQTNQDVVRQKLMGLSALIRGVRCQRHSQDQEVQLHDYYLSEPIAIGHLTAHGRKTSQGSIRQKQW